MKKKNGTTGCNEYYNYKEDKGRKNLINSFLDQKLLHNIPNINQIGEKFAKLSEVKGYTFDEIIYNQGDFGTNYLFFVLTGSCNLFVNDNFVAEIKKGESFGEFPILDSGVKYSVAAYSNEEETCIAKIAETKLREIAKMHPDIWENLARMLAERLKLISEETYKRKPNYKAKIFIGSSSEGLNVARIIQSQLSNDFEPAIWNQGTFFELGKSYLESLEGAVNKYDFGIFVFTPDDKVEIRGKSEKIARDNVIFELGMFIGKLTRMKAYLVCPSVTNLKILSDFDGITKATFDIEKTDLSAALGDACHKIRESIKSISSGYKIKPQ